VTSRSRWYWVPVGPDVRTVRYAPALVAFVGGPGFSASISLGGGGNVGWFPLAPHDPFVPWWGSRARETIPPAVTNVTYVNRTYVTVVNQNTFISGAPVATNTIRDARVLREVSVAPIVHGPLPVVPVASSIRVSTERAGSAPPPPATTLNRAVVTRLAPAPAPAPFSEKANLIRENRGAPVDPAQAARLAPAPREIQPTRSVVMESGRVNLAPKKAQTGVPAPVPVTREAPQGQARREAPPAGAREAPPGQAKSAPAPAIDSRKAQEAETVRKQQLQQQQIDSRKAQEAEAVRKQQLQQQQIDAKKAQEAEAARKQQLQQQQIDAKKAQEAEAARKQQLQQQQIDAKKAQEAEAARKQQLQQQQPVAKQKQVPGEKKAAPPTATPTDQKKEKDDKAKDKKDQPDGKDQG
jgi:DNA segregation ATPase FtsK/SpoIIIE-like protein